MTGRDPYSQPRPLPIVEAEPPVWREIALGLFIAALILIASMVAPV